MKIDLTLLVQVFNFYIAYRLVNGIFLKKAVSIVQNERHELVSVIKERDAQQASLETFEKELARDFQDGLTHIKNRVPQGILVHVNEAQPEGIEPVVFTAGEVEAQANQVTDYLVRRLQ